MLTQTEGSVSPPVELEAVRVTNYLAFRVLVAARSGRLEVIRLFVH